MPGALMADIKPVVRQMILCGDVRSDPAHPQQVTLANLLHAVRPPAGEGFPFVHVGFAVYLQLADGRGEGTAQVVTSFADSGVRLFGSSPRRLRFGADPLETSGLVFRLRDCRFPRPGLYWVEFWYNQECLAQQPLLLRGSSHE
jgi:hypothetical protein